MDALAYLLDGLEAELELERLLCVRAVECDRAVLAELAAPPHRAAGTTAGAEAEAARVSATEGAGAARVSTTAGTAGAGRPPDHETNETTSGAARVSASRIERDARVAFVILHDRPLSAEGKILVDKAVKALGLTPETAPLVTDKPVPPARVYLVMGGRALKKFYPGLKGDPGSTAPGPNGEKIVVTFSPDFLLRFKGDPPALKEKKLVLWSTFKMAFQNSRLRA